MRRRARRCRRGRTAPRVLMLEVAPEDQRGGNSAFTGGAFRVVYHGGEDLARLIPDMNETELNNVDFGTYTEEQYFDDMGRLTQYRCDPDLTEILIRSSFDTGVWMREKGRAVSARPRPPGVPRRRQVQVLGRARLPYLGRRQGAGQGVARPRRARRHRGALRDAGDRAADRRQWRGGGAGAPSGPYPRLAVKGGGAGLRRVRGQRRDAGALSRARLGSRQGARLALQHRPGPEDGARPRRRGRTGTGRARMPSPGI